MWLLQMSCLTNRKSLKQKWQSYKLLFLIFKWCFIWFKTLIRQAAVIMWEWVNKHIFVMHNGTKSQKCYCPSRSPMNGSDRLTMKQFVHGGKKVRKKLAVIFVETFSTGFVLTEGWDITEASFYEKIDLWYPYSSITKHNDPCLGIWASLEKLSLWKLYPLSSYGTHAKRREQANQHLPMHFSTLFFSRWV